MSSVQVLSDDERVVLNSIASKLADLSERHLLDEIGEATYAFAVHDLLNERLPTPSSPAHLEVLKRLKDWHEAMLITPEQLGTMRLRVIAASKILVRSSSSGAGQSSSSGATTLSKSSPISSSSSGAGTSSSSGAATSSKSSTISSSSSGAGQSSSSGATTPSKSSPISSTSSGADQSSSSGATTLSKSSPISSKGVANHGTSKATVKKSGREQVTGQARVTDQAFNRMSKVQGSLLSCGTSFNLTPKLELREQRKRAAEGEAYTAPRSINLRRETGRTCRV